MKLGFIGTGEITKSVVTGILASSISFKQIYISKRNNKISNILKKKNKKIKVTSSNQKIINNSNWIFLAVTPRVGNKILKKLKFKKNQIIISFISTIKMSDLKKIIKVKSSIVRAIPLPPISIMKGPIPIYPTNKKVQSFFNKIGKCFEIKNEKSSLNYWSTSSLMAPYYEMLNTTSKWLQKKGIKKIESQIYVTSLFSALSENALTNAKKDLKILIKKSQTPNGLNEQSLKYLIKSGFYKKLDNSLSNILKRLNL